MTLKVDISVQLTGKIADPRLERQVKDAINSGLHELAEIEGANSVRSQLYPGHGFRTGNLKNHINADLVGDFNAQVDAGANRYGSNLIYTNWIEGISKRNAISRFKGYRMFARMFAKLRTNDRAFQRYVGGAIMRVFNK
tara:strand:+ start:123 stop:539 length:417 start_codon:yes stop_codon:yes gene_type:complete